jgi:hypothetical protein
MYVSHKSRAVRYREIGVEVRAHADGMSNERARQRMREAAAVWDRLADLAERMDRVRLGESPAPTRCFEN